VQWFWFGNSSFGRRNESRECERMTRTQFTEIAAEVLDSLPEESRRRIRNVAVLVGDLQPGQGTLRQPDLRCSFPASAAT
jgi:predicted Zn-dependent protease with MMP-like domain